MHSSNRIGYIVFDIYRSTLDNKHVTRSSEKINTALSYIVGNAAPFAQRIRQEREDYIEWQLQEDRDPDDMPTACRIWDEFKVEFMNNYVDVDPTTTAQEKLAVMLMDPKEHADDFITRWKNVTVRTGYDGVALVCMFQDSLVLVPRLLTKALDLRVRPDGAEDQGGYCPDSIEEWYRTIGDFDHSYH